MRQQLLYQGSNIYFPMRKALKNDIFVWRRIRSKNIADIFFSYHFGEVVVYT